jgi:hypothetical protein
MGFSDRNQRSAPLQTQQPKTTPDDALKVLGRYETLRDNENASTRLVTQRVLVETRTKEEKAER